MRGKNAWTELCLKIRENDISMNDTYAAKKELNNAVLCPHSLCNCQQYCWHLNQMYGRNNAEQYCWHLQTMCVAKCCSVVFPLTLQQVDQWFLPCMTRWRQEVWGTCFTCIYYGCLNNDNNLHEHNTCTQALFSKEDIDHAQSATGLYKTGLIINFFAAKKCLCTRLQKRKVQLTIFYFTWYSYTHFQNYATRKILGVTLHTGVKYGIIIVQKSLFIVRRKIFSNGKIIVHVAFIVKLFSFGYMNENTSIYAYEFGM